MKCLMLDRREGKEIQFLRYGEFSIYQYDSPQSVTTEQIEEMVMKITDPTLRKMYNAKNEESLDIETEPHRAARLNGEYNEDIIVLSEIEIDWKSLSISVLRSWSVHVRLNPPLVKAVQNK
jgi:hypothetical protein